jgi:ATP-dependent DNA helicase UvrD/PcrA
VSTTRRRVNQCIYSTLPGVIGVGPERLTAALALSGARRIDLPDVSHRDPSNILPAAAARIRRREFDHDAVTAALDSGRLQIHSALSLDHEADEVSAVVQETD